jgi:hypothetical protein
MGCSPSKPIPRPTANPQNTPTQPIQRVDSVQEGHVAPSNTPNPVAPPTTQPQNTPTQPPHQRDSAQDEYTAPRNTTNLGTLPTNEASASTATVTISPAAESYGYYDVGYNWISRRENPEKWNEGSAHRPSGST